MHSSMKATKRIAAFALAIIVALSLAPARAQATNGWLCGTEPYGSQAGLPIKHNPPGSYKGKQYNGASGNNVDFATLYKTADRVVAPEIGSNVFDIKLEAHGEKIVPPPRPVYTVIVTDLSNSMVSGYINVPLSYERQSGWPLGWRIPGTQTGYTTNKNNAAVDYSKYSYTRLQQVQDAAYGYIEEMLDLATDPEGKNMIALASYAMEGRKDQGFTNNKSLLQNGINSYFKEQGTTGNYATNPIPGNSGSTNHQGGFIAAWQLIAAQKKLDAQTGEDPYYVVLYMSDGGTTQQYNTATSTRDSMETFVLTSASSAVNMYDSARAEAAASAIKGSSPDGGVLIATVSVGKGDSDDDASPETLEKFSTDGFAFESEASDESVAKIYEMIKDATDNPSIETGATLTDIVAKGFEVIETTAYGLDEKEIAGADIKTTKNSDGTTTVTWSNLPPVGANAYVRLVIRVNATDELLEEACTGIDGNHVTVETNEKATLKYTNITNQNSDDWTAEFPVPEVHISKERDGFYVTVNYVVIENGKNVVKKTVTSDPLDNNEPYGEFAIDSFEEKQNNAPFSHAIILLGNGNQEVAYSKEEYESKVKDLVVNGYDVTINLYYQILIADVGVPLTKTVSLGDPLMGFPAKYEFEFELHNEDGKLVGTLSFDQDDVEDTTSKFFIWEAGVDYYDDIDGQQLYISEKAASGWAPFTAKAYAIATDGNVELNGSSVVDNVRSQTKWSSDVEVILEKSFAGDFSSFNLQGKDGSVLDCIDPSHGGAGHSHDEDCYVLDCDIDEDDEEEEHTHEFPDCYVLECDIEPGAGSGEHDEDCYVYTFEFALENADGDVIDEQALELRKSEIIELGNGSIDVELVIPGDSIEEGPFTIKETDKPTGWSGFDISGITVNPYTGVVTYPDQANCAKMTNTFGGTGYPVFTVSKEVLDERAGDGSFAAGYNGTLKFDLLDEDKDKIDTFTIDIKAGVGTSTISLPDLINQDATLYLREVNDNQPGMSYDTNEYKITIVDGKVANTAPIVATNEYMEAISPVFRIIANTNSPDNNGNFTFEYSYIGSSGSGNGTDTVKIQTSNGSGVATLEDELPENFTGVLTVKATGADQPGSGEAWVLDDKVYEFIFEDGVYVGQEPIATATFLHNLLKPGVVFTKDASANVVNLNTPVTYSLTVINTGSETIENLEITDTHFKPNTMFTVYLNNNSTPVSRGFTYDGTTLRFDSLYRGGRIIINYTVTFTKDGPVENDANFKARGTQTKVLLDLDASKKIDVNEDLGGKKPLEVSKKVALQRGTSPVNQNSFVDTIETNIRGGKAVFRMTVTNNTSKVLKIEEAEDVFGGNKVTQFTTLDGKPFDPIGYEIEPKGSVTFYYTSGEMNDRGRYVNTLAVTTRVIEDGGSGDPVNYSDSDSATIIVRRIRDGGGKGSCKCDTPECKCKCGNNCKCTDKNCDGYCKGKCDGNCHKGKEGPCDCNTPNCKCRCGNKCTCNGKNCDGYCKGKCDGNCHKGEEGPCDCNTPNCKCRCGNKCTCNGKNCDGYCKGKCDGNCHKAEGPCKCNTPNCKCKCNNTCNCKDKNCDGYCKGKCDGNCHVNSNEGPCDCNTPNCECKCNNTCNCNGKNCDGYCKGKCDGNCHVNGNEGPCKCGTPNCECKCNNTCSCNGKNCDGYCKGKCDGNCHKGDGPCKCNTPNCECKCNNTCNCNGKNCDGYCKGKCDGNCHVNGNEGPCKCGTPNCKCKCNNTCNCNGKNCDGYCKGKCDGNCHKADGPCKCNTPNCKCKCNNTCNCNGKNCDGYCKGKCDGNCHVNGNEGPCKCNTPNCKCKCNNTCNCNGKNCDGYCKGKCDGNCHVNGNEGPCNCNTPNCKCKCNNTCNCTDKKCDGYCKGKCDGNCHASSHNHGNCDCGKTCKCKGKCNCTDKYCDGYCKGKCDGSCHKHDSDKGTCKCNTKDCKCKCNGTCKCTDKKCDGYCKGKCSGACHNIKNTAKVPVCRTVLLSCRLKKCGHY
ncbi:MAG: hypothetical protein FWG10_12450 [Eubacteriaceae bacterium]|nr:hypothetical protein [Eubacteriaceae bacterium]